MPPLGEANPCMGTLRLAVADAAGKLQWLDELSEVTATFRPGYTEYELKDPQAGWKATLAGRTRDGFPRAGLPHGVRRAVPLAWQYGGVWWQPAEANANRAEIQGGEVRIIEPNLPRRPGAGRLGRQRAGRVENTLFGQQAVFVATEAAALYPSAAAWGVTDTTGSGPKRPWPGSTPPSRPLGRSAGAL